jgi:hypothetical protein
MKLALSQWWFIAIDRHHITISTGWPLDLFWVLRC